MNALFMHIMLNATAPMKNKVSYRRSFPVLDRMYHADDALLHRDGKTVFFRRPHDVSTDEIDFRLSPVPEIRVDARVSVRSIFKMSADPLDLFFLVKYAFLQSCRPADLPDKIPADFPAWRIRSDIALPHGKHKAHRKVHSKKR